MIPRVPLAPLVLVAALYLATTAGTWVFSDHAELLTQARRLITRGTLALGQAGEPIPELPYWPVRPSRESRSRLYPGTAVAYAPFVAADALLGLGAPADFGPLASGAGHLYVLLALGLLARVALWRGASLPSVAAALVLVGTAWPVWQVSRHAGSEPVLGATFAAGLLAHVAGRRRGMALACAALPWLHPSGVLLAIGLAVAGLVEAAPAPGVGVRAGFGALAVSLAGLLAWNTAHHGHSWAGGYAVGGSVRHYLGTDVAGAAVYYLAESLQLAPAVLLVLLACGLGGRERRALLLPVLLLGLHVGLFAALSQPTGQEPGRRLAVVWLAALPAVAGGWGRIRPGRTASLAVLGGAVVSGLSGFWRTEAHYYPAADGGYLPLVWWLTLARAGAPLPALTLSLGLLAGVAALAFARTLRLALAPAEDAR